LLKCIDNVINIYLVIVYDINYRLLFFRNTLNTNMFKSLLKFQRLKGERKGKIWQLFHAKDFQSLMYPCFTFCRILGIFPYKINASTIETCKSCYILSIIIICVFCVYELISIYDINISKNVLFQNLPRILQLNCFYIFGGFIAVGTFILSGPRMRLLQTIQDLSLKLPSESHQNLSRLIHAKDIFGFFFLITQALIYYPRIQHGSLRHALLLYILLLIFQMDMLYMNCVCVLKACFKQINDKLANLRKLVAHGEPYLLRDTYHEQRNSFLLMELNVLKKQHLAISDTVQMLKTIFSLQLVCTIIITFIQITFNLYFYLVRIQGGVSMNLKKQVYYDSLITAVIYHIIKIVLVVWACETGKNQAMELSITIHNVFNATSDKQIKYEVNFKKS